MYGADEMRSGPSTFGQKKLGIKLLTSISWQAAQPTEPQLLNK